MRNGSPTGGGKGEMADRPTFQLIFCIFGNVRQAQIRLGAYKLVCNCMFDVYRLEVYLDKLMNTLPRCLDWSKYCWS